MNDFARQWVDVCDDAIHAFSETAAGGWYILGHEVESFESELARYWECTYAVGVASGLDAIEISLRVLGCKPGDKVLTTPISAFATTLAILKIGAVPVFCDIDKFGLVDLDAVQDVIHNQPDIKYFVPVHLYGHALNIEKLRLLERESGIAIVEDCAQSIGARWKTIPTAAIGQMAATSFYPTKNLGAMGDGGAILTANEHCARTARMLRDYGQSSKYRHDAIGYNSRLDEIQAALLRKVFLPRLNRWIDRRRKIAHAYIAGITNQAVHVPGTPADSCSCWHLFPVIVSGTRKSAFIEYLKNEQVSTAEHYPIAIPDQRALADVRHEIASTGIERARIFCRSEVSLPIHPYLSDGEVKTVIDVVNDWAG